MPAKKLPPRAPAQRPVHVQYPASPKKRASFATHTILVHVPDQLKAARMESEKRSPEVSPRQSLLRSASFADEKEALVVETIQAVGHAVQVAKAALEIASLNIRKRQSSQAMALGAGSCAADGDSDEEDEYAESTCSLSGQSLSEDSPSDSSTVGPASAHFHFLQTLKGIYDDDADAQTTSTCSSPRLPDMQENVQEQYSPQSMVSGRDGSARLSQTTQASALRRHSLSGERHLLKERKDSLMKQDWNDSILKKIEEIGPNVRPSLEC
jgi:hypothetical protein